jgi:hypothetical protein
MHRLLVALALLTTACASAPTYQEPDLMGPRPPRSIEEIELIEGSPERPYVVLGVWEALVESEFDKDATEFRDRIVARAAQLGADGVVFATTQEDVQGADTDVIGRQSTLETKVLAAIIVWIQQEREPVVRDVTMLEVPRGG